MRAALLLVIVGCHYSDHFPPDAAMVVDGPVDAAIDADLGPVGPVSIRILAYPPQAGIHVYFQNPDDSLAAAIDTDATGTARAMLPVGGSITAINPFPITLGGQHMHTFVDVHPGDTYVLEHATRDNATVAVTVTAPRSADAQVTKYQLRVPCGAASSTPVIGTSTVTFSATLDGCGAATDMLVLAEDDASVREWIFVPNVVPGVLDVTAKTYSPAATQTVTVSNLPAGTFSLSSSLSSARGELFTSSGQLSGAYVSEVPGFPGARSDLTLFGTGAFGFVRLIDREAWSASMSIDAMDRFLVDLAACPNIDRTARRLVWTESTAGAIPDLVAGYIGGSGWSWTIAGPRDGTAIRFPRIPTVTDVFAGSVTFGTLNRTKLGGGYQEIRAGRISSPFGGVPRDATGAIATSTVGGPMSPCH